MTTKEALAAADVTAVKEAAATVAEIKAAEAKAEAKKADSFIFLLQSKTI
jgi:hypothetical protein